MLAPLKIIAYKAIRRVVLVDITCFMLLDVDGLQSVESNLEIRIFDRFEDIARYLVNVPEQVSTVWCELLSQPKTYVCLAISEDAIAGQLWWRGDFVPPECNHNGPVATQLPLTLPTDTAFVFDVFVQPSFRGMRLYAAMLSHVKQTIQADASIEKFLITVDYSNRPAIRAAVRIGFVEVGHSMLIGLGAWSVAHYPDSKLFPVRVGKYRGDRDGARRQVDIPPLLDSQIQVNQSRRPT
jgi:GNAT superfamily N-acetyltransferase